MKSILTRAALAAALAMSLAACGGGKATFTVGGTVENLRYGPVVLTTNGQDISVAPKSPSGDLVSYSFPRQLEYGDQYDVVVKTHPPHQECVVRDGDDTAGRLSSIDVLVSCAITRYTIGGAISGLTVDGLVLTNGSTSGTLTIGKGATSYLMPSPVLWNESYGVTVLTQPAGLACSVANGTGVMGDAKVENINITCVPAA